MLPLAPGNRTSRHAEGWRRAPVARLTERRKANFVALPSRATRAQRAPLTVILPGSRLERREMAVPRAGEADGRDGGQPVTGGARGSARAEPAGGRGCKGGAASPLAVRIPQA